MRRLQSRLRSLQREKKSLEQRVADFVKDREAEMMTNLEKQISKRSDLSKKEVDEMLRTMESEIKVKMEAALLDARQNIMEKSSS